MTMRNTRTLALALAALGTFLLASGCSEPIEAPEAVIQSPGEGPFMVGQAITLDGSASTDPNDMGLSYRWRLISGPSGTQADFNRDDLPVVSFVPDVPSPVNDAGEPTRGYVFGLVVDNGVVSSEEATVEVMVTLCGANAPSVDSITATPEAPITGQVVQLDAVVTDADSAPACGLAQMLRYEWKIAAQPAGSQAKLNNPTGLNPSFQADRPGDYLIHLLVRDSDGHTSALGFLTVTVSACGDAAPTVDSVQPSPASPNTGDLVTLTVAASDADNDADTCGLSQGIALASRFLERPAGSAAALTPAEGSQPSFVADVPGDYVIETVATDSTGRTGSAQTTVTVSECGFADPSVDGVVATPANPNTGDLVTFAVTVSDADNASGCELGQVLTTTSEFVSRPAGSAATLSPAEGLSPAFVADVPGDYTIRTTVVDDTGRAAAMETTVTVSACGFADPSVDGVVATPANPNTGDLVTFAVTVSDADNASGCELGQVLTTTSEFVSRPAGSAATLSPAEGLSPAFVADVPGDYTIRTTVVDDTGRAAAMETTVTVSACGFADPSVDGVVATPANPNTGDLVTFAVTVSDADNGASGGGSPGGCGMGQVLTTTSAFVSRPAGSAATLSPAEGLSPAFVADVPGDYTIRTTVVDDTGRAATVDTTVTASACGSAPPSVDSVIPTPAAPNVGDAVTLAILTSDADNGAGCGLSQVLTVQSGFVARPAGSTAALAPQVGPSVAFVADMPGDYVIRSIVLDDTGLTASADTVVTVSECGSAPPALSVSGVSPAAPQTGDAVTITVAATDADNAPGCGMNQTLTYGSAIVAAPAGSSAQLAPANGPTPTFVADVPGDYVVRSWVSDSTGRTDSTDTVITVDACGSNPPVAMAAVVSPVAAGPGADVTATGAPVGFDVALDASASTDPDLQAACGQTGTLAYLWQFYAKPAGSKAQFNDPTLVNASFNPDQPGDYVVTLYVSDGAHVSTARATITVNSVTFLDQGNGVSVELVASGAAFDRPEGVAVGANGDVFVAQNGLNAVTRTSPLTGVTTLFSAGGYFQDVHDVAYFPADDAYFVTEQNLQTILRVNSQGQQELWVQIRAFGGPLRNPAGMALWTRSNGTPRLAIAEENDGRLRFFDPTDGAFAGSQGTESFGGSIDRLWDVDVAVIGGQNVYFATDRNQGEVWRTDGNNDRRLTQLLDEPRGILYAPGSNKVIVADSKLGFLVQIDNCGAGNCPTKLLAWGSWEPWGLAWETQGSSFYVTDRQGNALYRVTGNF